MDVYAISDLHLGPGSDKNHYSSKWKEHQPKIRTAWDERIPDSALVLMPGDFSWHQVPEDLIYDYYWIHDRTGQMKIISPGNHDYGVWTSQQRVIDFVARYDTLVPLMGDALRIDNPHDTNAPGIVVAAVRGTQSPGDKYFDSNQGYSAKDQEPEAVLFIRELARLRLALRSAKELQREGDELVVMIHYPPFVNGRDESPFSQLIEAAGAKLCVYGHLHQEAQWGSVFQGERNGVEYRFVGTDFLEFQPTRVGELTTEGLVLNPIERKVTTVWVTKENTTYSTTTTTVHKPAPKVQAVDGFGRAKVCVVCKKPIYQGEASHFGSKGPVHGTGDYDVYDTCPEISQAKTATSSWGKVTCIECGEYILKSQPKHGMAGDNWAHGHGAINQSGVCRIKHERDGTTPPATTPVTTPVTATTATPATTAQTATAPATTSLATTATATAPAQSGSNEEIWAQMRAVADDFAQGTITHDAMETAIAKILEENPDLQLY